MGAVDIPHIAPTGEKRSGFFLRSCMQLTGVAALSFTKLIAGLAAAICGLTGFFGRGLDAVSA